MTPNAFDTGNIAFMLVAASLVMLMTPGLAFFYGGLVGRKNVLAIMIQSFVSMGWTTFLWWACGFSLVFSGGEGGVIGNLHYAFLHGVRPDSLITVNANTPSAYTMSLLVLFVYQMMFAIITPALDHRRLRQPDQVPGLHDLPHPVDVLRLLPDRAHGLGQRPVRQVGRARLRRRHRGAHHRRLRRPGLGALRGQAPDPWTRDPTAFRSSPWAPPCSGSAGTASTPAVNCTSTPTTLVAFANTDICASVAAITWLGLAWNFEKKPKFVGLLTGAVAGLVAITPAAGYVSPTGAVCIGLIVSVVCYMAVELKNHLGLDDALDVWGCHGVGGVIGCICTGIFATTVWNAGGADGLLRGGVHFFAFQVLSVGHHHGLCLPVQLCRPVAHRPGHRR